MHPNLKTIHWKTKTYSITRTIIQFSYGDKDYAGGYQQKLCKDKIGPRNKIDIIWTGTMKKHQKIENSHNGQIFLTVFDHMAVPWNKTFQN